MLDFYRSTININLSLTTSKFSLTKFIDGQITAQDINYHVVPPVSCPGGGGHRFRRNKISNEALQVPQQTYEHNAEKQKYIQGKIIYLKNLADTKITYLDCARTCD